MKSMALLQNFAWSGASFITKYFNTLFITKLIFYSLSQTYEERQQYVAMVINKTINKIL